MAKFQANSNAVNRMAALLNKFRIDYSDLIVVTDVNDPPKETTKVWFANLIREFRTDNLHGKFSHYLFK